jgi:hypothetical protein
VLVHAVLQALLMLCVRTCCPYLQTGAQAEDNVSPLSSVRCPPPVERLLQDAPLPEMYDGVPEIAPAVGAPPPRPVPVPRGALRHVKESHKLPHRGTGSTHL